MNRWRVLSATCCAVVTTEETLPAAVTPTETFTWDLAPAERHELLPGDVQTTYVLVVFPLVVGERGGPADAEGDTSQGRTVSDLAAEQRAFLDELRRTGEVGEEYVESPD